MFGAQSTARFLGLCLVLAPTFRPNDPVVLDNLGAREVKGVAEAIEAPGGELLICRPTVRI